MVIGLVAAIGYSVYQTARVEEHAQRINALQHEVNQLQQSVAAQHSVNGKAPVEEHAETIEKLEAQLNYIQGVVSKHHTRLGTLETTPQQVNSGVDSWTLDRKLRELESRMNTADCALSGVLC